MVFGLWSFFPLSRKLEIKRLKTEDLSPKSHPTLKTAITNQKNRFVLKHLFLLLIFDC
jgi:hypothetical protein